MGSELKNRCFVIAMCLENQPRWRRLQTINSVKYLHYMIAGLTMRVLMKEVMTK